MSLNSLILLTPLLNFLIIFCFGQSLGYKGCSFFSICFSFLFIVFTLISVCNCLNGDVVTILTFGTWLKADFLTVKWEFVFDFLSLSMLFLISIVSFTVQVYSIEYMHTDPFKSKFLGYISLFVFCMTILVTAKNILVLLIGWEGVGVCSFLLISFWNTRISACKAALKAIIFNRIGDMGLFIGIALIVCFTKSVDFHLISVYLPFLKNVYILFGNTIQICVIDIICFFLFFGSMGKSAQIGFHVWLLDAMEGPTPVSALIHAATMVTAGVFVLLRFSFILEFAIYTKIFIAVVGAVTALLTSIMATVNNDIKSIIAYSTCSQLGYMVTMCGLSAYPIALFHLVNHGFFKALLFLSAGIIIHNFHEEQDIRKMGGLFYLFPITYTFFIIASSSLVGVPFLSGYYSKDAILEYVSVLPFNWCNCLYNFLLFAVFFTSWYSIRLIYYVFICKPNGFKVYYKGKFFEKYTLFSLFSMTILALLSIYFGKFASVLFIGPGSLLCSFSLFNHCYLYKLSIFAEFYLLSSSNIWFVCKLNTVYVMLISFFSFFVSINISSKIYEKFICNKFYRMLISFLTEGMFFNFTYNYVTTKIFNIVAWEAFLLEKLFLELYGPNLWHENFYKMSFELNKLSYKKSPTDIFFFLMYMSILTLGIFLFFKV